MSDGRTPSRNSYDVIVIGSGVGGLTTAALLAKRGMSVLVAERSETLGGYGRALRDNGYTVNVVASLCDPSVFDALVSHLDVDDLCSLIRSESYFQGVLPDVRFDVPLDGIDALSEAHAEAAPWAEEDVRRFFEVCRDVHEQAHKTPQTIGLRDLDRYVREYPMAFKFRKATVAEVLAEFIPDERARAVCGLTSLWQGLPPSRVSFQSFAQMTCAHAVDGAFYFAGGAHTFVAALAAAVERAGSEIAVGCGVEKILVEGGRTTGVVLDGGGRLRAPAVVSNADAPRTFGELLGSDHLPRNFPRKLDRLAVGPSAVAIVVATDHDLVAAGARDTVIVSGWDLDRSYWRSAAGEPEAVMMRIPTIVDPSLAPPGEHLVTVFAFTPRGSGWDGRSYEEKLLAVADRVFPGLGESAQSVELATPDTFAELSSIPGGPAYGWEASCAAAGSGRPAPKTPVPGLYLAGAWTQPGGCAFKSMLSGVFASRLLVSDSGIGWDGLAFEHPTMPPLG